MLRGLGWPCLGVAGTGRAAAPEDDLGFVDLESGRVVRCEAGRVAERAVDVDGEAAATADEVMVVVADTGFEARRTAGWFDAAHEACCLKRPQNVVHGLRRERPQSLLCRVLDLVNRHVGWQLVEYGKHR